jgi:hypothetical protein
MTALTVIPTSTFSLLRLRDMLDNAYQHESDYCELNRATWEPRELMAALCTLETLHLAEKQVHEAWSDLAWRERNARK